jgi:hypothetical protein
VHELLVGAMAGGATHGASLFAGRGFVPFGSDDPMLRPFVAFPANHHLAQILERLVLVAAVSAGPVVGEAALFNGDEPLDPSTPPLLRRFADSWAVRGTLRGDRIAARLAGAELVASYAAVRSPEYREGQGLDQRKVHLGARFARHGPAAFAYALAEWARTEDIDRGRSLYRFTSVLAEAAVCGRAGLALRLERSDRPEEERLLNPFRSVRPAVDNSIVGVSRWTTASAAASLPVAPLGANRLAPFVEAARSVVTRATRAAFDPTLLYGSNTPWRLSTGVRITAGGVHGRMGRYGVAGDDGTTPHAMAAHAPAGGEPRCFT